MSNYELDSLLKRAKELLAQGDKKQADKLFREIKRLRKGNNESSN